MVASICVLQEEQVHEVSFNKAALIVAADSIQCYNFYIAFRSRAEDSFINRITLITLGCRLNNWGIFHGAIHR